MTFWYFEKTPEEHICYLRFKTVNDSVCWSLNCRSFKEETKYLGLVINKKEEKSDMDKVELIRSMPEWGYSEESWDIRGDLSSDSPGLQYP